MQLRHCYTFCVIARISLRLHHKRLAGRLLATRRHHAAHTFETSKCLAVTAAARLAQAAARRARLLRRWLRAMVPLRSAGGGAVHLVLGAAEAEAVHAAVKLRLALGAALHAAATVWRCPQVLGACTCTTGRSPRGGATIKAGALSRLRWARQWARCGLHLGRGDAAQHPYVVIHSGM